MNARVFVVGATIVATLAAGLSCTAEPRDSAASAVGADSATPRDDSVASMPSAADSVRLHRAMLTELSMLASNPDFDVEFDTTRVSFAPRLLSRAVPGLEYHWAHLESRVTSHGGIWALIATRDTLMRAVRHAVDWSAIARDWTPSTREAAAWACAELYRIQYHGGPRDQAEVFGLDSLPTQALLSGEREWLEKQLPDTFVVENRPNHARGRRVRLWVVNPEMRTLADEVACELPEPM